MTYHREKCARKTRYWSRSQAQRVLDRRRDEDPVEMEGVVVYRCPFGSHHHLGHTPSMESLESMAREIRGLV